MSTPPKTLWLIPLVISILMDSVSWAGEYVGAEQCKGCHEAQYGQWHKSGHASMLSRVGTGKSPALVYPEGHDQRTVSYVIGGLRWKALFLDKNGYFITSTPSGEGKNQYNMQSARWVDYLPGQKVGYSCGRCHTTGYSPEGHQDGLEGIQGTWKFDGIQCEGCHGPGGKHVDSTLRADISIDRSICPDCHGVVPHDVIPRSGVFLGPYTETNQLLAGSKKNFACPNCHNPHPPGATSIRQGCADCHDDIAAQYDGSLMHRVGVTCLDCHMPPAGIIAEGDAQACRGDFKSHVFDIDYRKPFPTPAEDGPGVSPGYLTVDFACMRCHQTYENRAWAVRYSMFVHSIKVTTNVKIKRFQLVFCAIGFFFALLAFLAALSLKNYLWPALDRKKMLAVHRNCAWISFYVWWFMSAMSVYFLFPFDDPGRVLNLGWFLVHLIGGVFGLVFYIGKILAVRIFRKGWHWQGAFFGIGLFVFWLIDFLTVLFKTSLHIDLAGLLF
jgi:hypothetical protein